MPPKRRRAGRRWQNPQAAARSYRSIGHAAPLPSTVTTPAGRMVMRSPGDWAKHKTRRCANATTTAARSVSFAPGPATPRADAGKITLAPRKSRRAARALLHRAFRCVGVFVVLEYLFDNLGLIFAIRALGDLDQIEILNGIVISVEFEIAAQ